MGRVVEAVKKSVVIAFGYALCAVAGTLLGPVESLVLRAWRVLLMTLKLSGLRRCFTYKLLRLTSGSLQGRGNCIRCKKATIMLITLDIS